jgi:septation ring formation regulator EzrA
VLVNNAEKVFIDFRRKKSKSAVLAFQNKVDSLESSIDATLLRMGEYEDQNNALVSSVDKMKRLRLTIDMEALKVSYGEYIKGLEMSKVELLNLEPTFKYFDAPTYPLRKKEKSSVLAGFLGLFVSVILIILVLIAREEVGKFKVNS